MSSTKIIKPSTNPGAKPDSVEKPFEYGKGKSAADNKSGRPSQGKLTYAIEKNQPGGNLLAPSDLPDGEYSVPAMLARGEARTAEYKKAYESNSMGEGDRKPIPGDKLKPVYPTVVDYGRGK